MQIQDFFAPAARMMAELIPNVKSPVKSVEFNGRFPEYFRLTHQFACNDLVPQTTFDHSQLDEQKKSEMLQAFSKDLDGITTNPDKVSRCYQFFEQVARELLQAKTMNFFQVVVRESNGNTFCLYYLRK